MRVQQNAVENELTNHLMTSVNVSLGPGTDVGFELETRQIGYHELGAHLLDHAEVPLAAYKPFFPGTIALLVASPHSFLVS